MHTTEFGHRVSFADVTAVEASVIPGLRPGHVGMLISRDPEAAVSFVVQSACAAVAGTPDVLPIAASKRGIGVLLTHCTPDDVRAQLGAIVRSMPDGEGALAKLDDEHGLTIVPTSGVDTRILQPSDEGAAEGPYYQALLAMAQSNRLVIVDALDSLSGHNVSDGVWVQAVMQTLTRIAQLTDCSILIVHRGQRYAHSGYEPLRSKGHGFIDKGAAITYCFEPCADYANGTDGYDIAEADATAGTVWRCYAWDDVHSALDYDAAFTLDDGKWIPYAESAAQPEANATQHVALDAPRSRTEEAFAARQAQVDRYSTDVSVTEVDADAAAPERSIHLAAA